MKALFASSHWKLIGDGNQERDIISTKALQLGRIKYLSLVVTLPYGSDSSHQTPHTKRLSYATEIIIKIKKSYSGQMPDLFLNFSVYGLLSFNSVFL